MSDADCTPGREPRSVAASLSVISCNCVVPPFLHVRLNGRFAGEPGLAGSSSVLCLFVPEENL